MKRRKGRPKMWNKVLKQPKAKRKGILNTFNMKRVNGGVIVNGPVNKSCYVKWVTLLNYMVKECKVTQIFPTKTYIFSCSRFLNICLIVTIYLKCDIPPTNTTPPTPITPPCFLPPGKLAQKTGAQKAAKRLHQILFTPNASAAGYPPTPC